MELQGQRCTRATALLALVLGAAVTALAQVRETQRLAACRTVLEAIARMPEGIPRDLLNKAECVAIVPGVGARAWGCRSAGSRPTTCS